MSDKIRKEDAPQDQLVIEKPAKPLADPKLARYAGYHGAWETAAAHRGKALFTPLHISNSTSRTVPGYQAFAEQYELYKVPAHHATVALGRVNDLHQSGAPRTPAEVPAHTMKFFHKVDNVADGTNDKLKSQAANQWIEQQDELHSTFDGYMASREALSGAMSEWRSVQALLRGKALGRKRDEKLEDKKKLDEMVETITTIVEVSAEALTITYGLEKELTEGVEETYTSTVEMEGGQAVPTAEVARKYKLEKLTEVAKKAGNAIGFKELFLIADGSLAKYNRLEKEIAKLNELVAQEQLAQEKHHIDAAVKGLNGVRIEIKGRQRAFEGKRSDARNAAQAFGQSMNGRQASIMVCMMAEAYQELDLFGTRALEESNQLGPKLQRVWDWLNDKTDKYKAVRQEQFDPTSLGFSDDFRVLGGAAVDAIKSRDLFQVEQPKWHQAGTAWRHFLSDVMDKKFDPQAADIDNQQGVKPKV